MASVVDDGILSQSLSLFAGEMGANAARRQKAADQLGVNSEYSWTIAMQTPTFMAAQGQRLATESGSGRTRAETNNPVETGVGTPGAVAVKSG